MNQNFLQTLQKYNINSTWESLSAFIKADDPAGFGSNTWGGFAKWYRWHER